MSKRIILKFGHIFCEKCKRRAMTTIACVEGVDSISFNLGTQIVTVIGDIGDPTYLVSLLRKYAPAELISVRPTPDPNAQFNFTPASHHTSSASASTSTSTSTCGYVYDVFLSHRGPDAKKGLASHLYHVLTKYGYQVFLDNEEMRRGENLTPQIEGAIQTASVHIAIFSPRYAESKWCLKELVLILESMLDRGSTILPVFYGVQPSCLRRIEGKNEGYALALSKLEQDKIHDSQSNQEKPRYNPSTIDKWRKALSDAAEISGFELEACNNDEGHLAEKVVQEVLKKVSKTPPNVAKYPTGLDGKIQDFERTVLLQQQIQETRVIGILGPGGIGKTTLAKEIFNRHLSKYKKSCFLFDVRESPLISLQNQLLKDFEAQVDKQIHHVDFGIAEIKKHLRFSSDPILMVLDDVDRDDQLDALLEPVKENLHSGSLILITSRNKDVLISSRIAESSIYMQTGLNPQYSRQLFCWHAFGQRNPVVGFEPEVDSFLSVCGGLPLSLKVFGALLSGRNDLKYWKAQLRKLERILPQDIQKRLRISYDSLDGEGKQIFLDIACFFIGEDKDTAIRIWDGCGWDGWLGLRTLENRCLVDVDSKNCIKMHDHLRDMGRHISEEEPHREGMRLWHQPNNGPLSENSFVRGIGMLGENGREWFEQSFENHAGGRFVINMSRLQLLKGKGHCVESIFRAGLSPQSIFRVEQSTDSSQLRWLCWDDCPYSFLPPWITVQNLTVLQIEGPKLKTLWLDESQVPFHLRELNIKARRFEIPKSIGKLRDLQKFVLHYTAYEDAVVMETLPDGFCDLNSLEHLELKNSKIESLPHSFGKLTNLRCIRLSGCSNLKMLPDSLDNLVNLQDIQLSLSHLKMLPESVGDWAELQHINLSNCSILQMLPDSFGNLRNLQDIDLSRCSQLKTLPDSFGDLAKLKHINLSNCSILQMLPDSFGNLRNLQDIDLSRCSQLKTLPDSFGDLANLEHINLSGCSIWQMLPDSFGNLRNLQDIDLSWCSQLKTLPNSFGNLRNLQDIKLSWCSDLKELPDSFGKLNNLQHISLSDCLELNTLPQSFGNLENLQDINLSWCSKLKTLPETFANLKNLQRINLDGCLDLRTLPDIFEDLTNLRHLNLSNCPHLENRPISLENLIQRQSQM